MACRILSFEAVTHVDKNKRWRWVRVALTVVGFTTLMADGGLREDEIDCEQAVAHLQECCPGFAQSETLQCVYSDGCGVTEPAISIPQSQCILGESCEQITASGLCSRAAMLSSPSTSSDNAGPPTPNAVCP